MTEPRKWERSDHDQWDIVTSVGYTALFVAALRALHTAGPDPFARDDYAKHFVVAAADPYLRRVLAEPRTSEDATAFPRLYGVQTRFFDEFFRSAADDGIRQAVILAAGLDSRAYRLQWPSGTTVFEVDQPKVLDFKHRVLTGLGAGAAAGRNEVAADLRTDWSIPLAAAGFDPERPTAWSVEGLLGYLTGAAQDALFTRIGLLSAAGSRLAVGAMGSHFDPEEFSALEANHPEVNILGDIDFEALTYDSDSRAAPAHWLAGHGWTVGDVRTTLELQADYGRPAPGVDAEVDAALRSQYLVATRRIPEFE